MRQINLLPTELRDREVTQRTVPFLVVAMVAGIVAVLIPWYTLRQLTDQLSTQVANRQTQLGLVKSSTAMAVTDKNQTDLEDLTTRTSILNGLAKTQVDWQRAFTILQQSLPQDITLKTYDISVGGKTPTISMTGTAASNLVFASFADSMMTNKNFATATVNGFTYNASDGGVTFSLTLTVLPATIDFNPAT